MGKRAREKKLAKIEAARAQQMIMETRKNEQRQPQLRYLKRISLALAVTVFLLWLGSVVVDRINVLVKG